jgi:CheY-like chemotaxis protein
VDDDELFLQVIADDIVGRFPALRVEICAHPLEALPLLAMPADLLLIDCEMPMVDGGKLLSYAVSAGIDRRRIIILSGHDANYLHERFPLGTCLAVINKHDLRQRAVLDMVLESLQQKASSRDVARHMCLEV